MSQTTRSYTFTVGDLITLIKEHASLSFPSHPFQNLRVITWHTDSGKVQAAVIANRVGTVPATSGSGGSGSGGGDTKSSKVQNKMLYRTEVQGGRTEDALRQLLKGLEGMSMQRFRQVAAGSVV